MLNPECGRQERKRQRVLFLPLLGTLAKQLLESAARMVGSKLLEKLDKKSLEVEKDGEKAIDDEEKE